MNEELVAYLSRYIPITEDLAAAFLKSSLLQKFTKGSILLREGDRVKKSFFILRGCIRSYMLRDGEDKTVEFYIEEDAILPVGYGKETPSDIFLECLEETVAVVGTPDMEAKMLAEYPQLKSVCLAMSEVMAEKLQANLASYLGVQPESLSRIRKRISRRS